MADAIGKQEFGHASLGDVQGFDCGADPWCVELNEWIRCVRPDESALSAMATRGTTVWLYRNEANQIVGFGSLGITEFRLPKHRDEFQAVPYLPMIAVAKQFQGLPQGPGETAYAVQIMDDLQHEAIELRRRKNLYRAVGLHVRIENEHAIKFYEQYGFYKLHKPHKGLWRMVLALPE